jgi:hypothetical protein
MLSNYIIAHGDDLQVLIRLLTNCTSVEIIQKDIDIGCCATVPKYLLIDKIFVVKNGETLNLKYSFPEVIQTLDNYRISYKMCV